MRKMFAEVSISAGTAAAMKASRAEVMKSVHDVAVRAAVNCWIPAVTSGKVPGGRSGLAAAVVQESLVVLIGGIRGRKWLNEVVVLDSGA